MSARRVSLTRPAPLPWFVPSASVARVSLAWWDPTEPEGKREPILVDSGGRTHTLVVVWPTCSRGRVDIEEVRAGRVDLLPWDVTDHLDRLRALAADWPLDLHDLLVGGGRIWPCHETLRRFPLDLDLDRRAERLAAQCDKAGWPDA